jgi:Tfp pilus assembly protein PilF
VYYLQQRDAAAESALHRALHLDPTLASSRFELARVYQREGKYKQALAEIDATEKLDSKSYSVHYVRGQILRKLGRIQEARAEMKTVTSLMESLRSKREQELYGGPLPSPELTRSPQ